MMPKTPQQILDDIEPNLIAEGFMARTVELPNGDEAEFWVKKREAWIVGPTSTTRFPWFDPTPYTDDQLAKRVHDLLPYL